MDYIQEMNCAHMCTCTQSYILIQIDLYVLVNAAYSAGSADSQ